MTWRLEKAQKLERVVTWRLAAQQSGQFYWHDITVGGFVEEDKFMNFLSWIVLKNTAMEGGN